MQILRSMLNTGLVNFSDSNRLTKPSATASLAYLVENTMYGLHEAVVSENQATAGAMIENIRNMSGVLSEYWGFKKAGEYVEQNLKLVKFEDKDLGRSTERNAVLVQFPLKILKDEAGYHLGPYYFVGADNTVHVAN